VQQADRPNYSKVERYVLNFVGRIANYQKRSGPGVCLDCGVDVANTSLGHPEFGD